MSTEPPPISPSDEHARRRAFAVCIAVAMFTIGELSKINVGVPAIGEALTADSTQLQLIVSGYTLAFGLTLIPAGRLGDIRSRRPVLLLGIVLFTATSILCAVAPSAEFLVAARLLQGAAAGIQMPQVTGMIQELYRGPARGRAFGTLGASLGITTAISPTIGGLLIGLGGEADGWRWLFWVNLPLGIATLVLALRLLPPTRSGLVAPSRVGMDPVGVLLLAAATFGLLVPFVFTTGSPDDDPWRWAWLAVSAAAGIAFAGWESTYRRRGLQPLIDFALFRRTSFRVGILVGLAYFAGGPATFLVTTLFLQQGLGVLPVYAGMVTIPFALASAVSAPFAGRLLQRYGRATVTVGLCGSVLGFALVPFAGILSPPSWAPWLIAASLSISGTCSGVVLAVNAALTLEEVPLADAGVGGSINQVAQRTGTSIGTALAATVFFATVYQGAAASDQIAVHHLALGASVSVAVGFLVLAAAISFFDLRKRRPGR